MNQKIYQKIAKKLNLRTEEVENAYNYFWKFYIDTLGNIPLKPDISKEEFRLLRTSFNIPNIGKIYCPFERCKNLEKVKEYRNGNKRLKEDKTIIYKDSNNSR